jgi:hypothetical protein
VAESELKQLNPSNLMFDFSWINMLIKNQSEDLQDTEDLEMLRGQLEDYERLCKEEWNDNFASHL